MNKRDYLCEATSYVLFIRVERLIEVVVGKMRNVRFGKGTYLYAGSAKRGLIARIRRHLSEDKKLFWHIDYLLSSPYAYIDSVWVAGGDKECLIADIFYRQGYEFVKDFGSSDCRCASHLFFMGSRLREGRELLRKKGFSNADKDSF